MAAIESPFKSVTTYNTIANTCMECKTCWMPFSKININIPQDQLQDTYQAWLILAQINGLSDLKTRFTQSSDNVLSPMRLPEQRLAFIPVFTRLWIHTTRHTCKHVASSCVLHPDFQTPCQQHTAWSSPRVWQQWWALPQPSIHQAVWQRPERGETHPVTGHGSNWADWCRNTIISAQ